MSRRAQQLASDLERGIRAIIQRGLHDPRISGLITVTGVEVSPDLRAARVRISVLPEEKQALTIHGLAAAAAHIRHELSEMISARSIPEISFRPDDAPKRQAEVLRAISKAREDLEHRPGAHSQDKSSSDARSTGHAPAETEPAP